MGFGSLQIDLQALLVMGEHVEVQMRLVDGWLGAGHGPWIDRFRSFRRVFQSMFIMFIDFHRFSIDFHCFVHAFSNSFHLFSLNLNGFEWLSRLRQLIRRESLEQLCEYITSNGFQRLRAWFNSMRADQFGCVDITQAWQGLGSWKTVGKRWKTIGKSCKTW